MTEAAEATQPKPLDQILAALDAGRMHRIRRMLGAMHAAEIANLLESLPPAQRTIVWGVVLPEDQGDVLIELGEEVRAGLIRDMDSRELYEATEGLEVDDLVDFIQDLPDKLTHEILQLMDRQDRERITTVLSFDEDTAGGLMNLDTVTVRADVTLGVVLRYLQLRGDLPDHTDTLIVVNRHGKYQGLLSLETLVTSDPELTVGDVIDRDALALQADTSANEVAKLFENRDLYSAAVVDDSGTLLGRVTVDDVVDVIRENADRETLGRVGLSEEDDIFSPVVSSTKRRAVWLGINLVTALMASWVIGNFQGTLEKLVALAVLMPIVASMGGIAGTQTMTIVIRAIALDQIGKSNTRWLLYKELAVGVLNGLLWALVVALIAWLWFKNPTLAAVIGAAILVNQVIAALCGVFIPLALKKRNIDPALAGGVVLTAVTDMCGFLIFLGLATLILV